MNNTELINELAAIGLNQLEAEIYLTLLANGPLTGYAIAKQLNKAVANVYKAIESMGNKGAIEVSTSDKKNCKAVDWQQLLQRKKAQFEHTLSTLEKSLPAIEQHHQDGEVYKITNLQQMIENTVTLINNAKSCLLVDMEPGAVLLLKPMLEQACLRGVEVWVKLYVPDEIVGANVIIRDQSNPIHHKIPTISFTIAADGNAMLMAELSEDSQNIVQAFRSTTPLMALAIYNGLLYEIVLTELKKLIPAGHLEAAQALLNQTAHLHPLSTENYVYSQFEAGIAKLKDLNS